MKNKKWPQKNFIFTTTTKINKKREPIKPIIAHLKQKGTKLNPNT